MNYFKWPRHRTAFQALTILVLGVSLSIVYSIRSYPDVVWQDGMFILASIERPIAGLGCWFPVFGEHLLPVWRLQVLASLTLLNLDMRTDCLAFILSNSIVFATTMYCLRRALALMPLLPFLAISLVIGFISFSLVQAPLTCMSAQFSLGSAFGFLTAALAVELTARRGLTVNLLYIISIIAYYLCSGGYFPGFIFGMIGLVAAMILNGRYDRNNFFLILSPVFIGACCYLGLLYYLKAGAAASNSTGILARVLDFPDTIKWILTAVGGSVMDVHTLRDNDWPIQILPIIGFILALAAGAMIVASKIGGYVPPLAIYGLFYPVGIIVAVHAGRGGEGVSYDWIVNEWYSFHFKFFLLGFIVLALDRLVASGSRHKYFVIFRFVLFVIIPIMVISNVCQWRRGPFIYSWLMEKREALRQPPSDVRAKIVCWDRDTVDRVIPFLRERKLSSFRDPGFLDLPVIQITAGWYTDGWMGPQVQVEINVPEATHFQFNFWTPPELGDSSMTIVMNGNTELIIPLKPSVKSFATFEVPAGNSKLTFTASNSFVPKILGTNLDARSLSLIGSLHRQVLTQVYPKVEAVH